MPLAKYLNVDPARPRYDIVPMQVDSPLFDGALYVYTQTWNQPWDYAYNFFLRCALFYPDYRAFVAVKAPDQEVIGFGFGTRTQAGQWWHDQVSEQLGHDNPALQNAWILTELAILDGYRGYGIGTEIHDRLIATQPHPRLVLSTEVSNQRARIFYEQHGWRYLHMGFAFAPGQAPYLIMGKELANTPLTRDKSDANATH